MSAAPQPRQNPDRPPAVLPDWARPVRGARLASAAGSALLLLLDFAILYACYWAGYELRVGLVTRLAAFSGRGDPVGAEAYLFFITIYLAVFALSGLYTRRVSSLEESVMVLRACVYATAAALLLSALVHLAQVFSRTIVAISLVLSAVVMPAVHFFVKRRLARWRLWQRPVALIGVNPNGLRAAADLDADPVAGYRVAGIFAAGTPPPGLPWPVWRVSDSTAAVAECRSLGLRSFILCEDSRDPGALVESFRELEEFADEIKIAAADGSLHSWRMQSEVLRSSYLLGYENPLTRPANRMVKRAMDATLASALLLLLAPVLGAIALAIRVTAGRPVLFRQVRLGRGGRRFSCLKFRTMHANAEDRLRRMIREDPQARAEYAATFKLRRDPRVTSLGGWLRRTSLDELPQLWNVVRGQMSLVGPRPIVPEETAKYEPDLASYFHVPCGVSGLWQISGRSDLSYGQRVRLDLFYIRNWSVWLDIVILVRTVGYLLRPRGAY